MAGNEFDDILEAIYGGFPILFLGSGFSTLARNQQDNFMKTGGGFSKLLHEKLRYTKEYPLDIVAREFKEKFGEHSLFKLLETEFVSTQTSRTQQVICGLPWKRIYTTNYDDVVEECFKKNTQKIESINSVTTQAIELKKATTSVIHLNGKVHNLEFSNFDRSIRLTRASYLTSEFIDTAWFSIFNSDLSVSSAVIIIGFSTYDIDIARIMYQNPVLKQKTYFVETVDLDPVIKKELEQFGTVIQASLDRFAKEIDNYKPISARERNC